MTIPDTACQRCRGQKLRCGKERPVCARCSRLGKSCDYPRPANRKELAAQRKLRLAQTRKESGQDAAQVAAPPAQRRSTPQPEDNSITGSSQDQVPGFVATSGPLASLTSTGHGHPDGVVDPANLPPRAIGLGLLEIYFARIYNAELLFQKSALFQAYLSDAIAPYLLRAVFALATIFLEEPISEDSSLRPAADVRRRPAVPSELSLLRTYAASGNAWADAAAAQVLPQVVSPSIQVVQALCCLGLYSFAKSDQLQPKIYFSLAYTCSSSFCGIRFLGEEGEEVSESPELEEKRRTFWASWASLCVAAIPEAHAKNSWDEASGVVLPQAPNGSFQREFMDRHWECHTLRVHQNAVAGSSGSIMGEMMKLMGIWARAQILLRESHSSPNAPKLETLSAMAHRLYHSATFPSINSNAIKQHGSHLLGLHSLYHLCRMTLLCPLVSIFSGRVQSEGSPYEDVAAKAQVIVSHAIKQAQLVRAFLSKLADVSVVSPLTGFASFVSASTLLHASKSWISRTQPDDSAMRDGIQEVSTIIFESLHLLEILQTYWTTLRSMTQRLRQSINNCPELFDFVQRTGEPSGAVSIPFACANTPLDGEEAVQMTYVEDQSRFSEKTTGESISWHDSRAQMNFQEPEIAADMYFDYENILHLPLGDDWDIDFMTFNEIG